MPGFPKPRFSYDYDLNKELKALRDYPKQPEKEDRAIPAKAKGHLLLATWNIANLGVQDRREKDYRPIAVDHLLVRPDRDPGDQRQPRGPAGDPGATGRRATKRCSRIPAATTSASPSSTTPSVCRCSKRSAG